MSFSTTSSSSSTSTAQNYNSGNQITNSATQKKKEFYFTISRPVSEKRLQEMKKEILDPFKLPFELISLMDVEKYWEEQKNKKMAENKRKLWNRHTHRSRLSLKWKRERIFVAEEIKLPGKSIVEDIDPEFFTLASGRPIKEKNSIRRYREDVRNCFLTRLKIGYHLDQILLMDEQYFNEKNKLYEVQKKFQMCLRSFECFLKEDHGSSFSLLEMAKEESRKSKDKSRQLDELKQQMKKLQVQVSVLEEKWRQCKMFQKFLYVVAPSEWKKSHDSYYKTEGVGDVALGDPCGFDSFSEFPGATDPDLDVRISKFKEDIKKPFAPSLYFTDPQQLINILQELEKNNLRVLAHSIKLDFPAGKVLKGVEKVKLQYENDEKLLKEEITFLKHLICLEEEKSKAYEKNLKKIAFGVFKELVTNEEYLTIVAFVEDAYEDAVAPNLLNLGIVDMIKEIELKYETLLLALDNMPNSIMVQSTKKFVRQQKKELDEAREAEKKVHQMEILLKRLSKSLEKFKKGMKERKIVKRSAPPEELMFKYELPKILTKEEIDFLFFFGTPQHTQLHKPLCP